MNKILCFLIFLLAFSSATFADINSEIKKIVLDQFPDAKIIESDAKLRIAYKTAFFSNYDISKYGELIGPNKIEYPGLEGFILETEIIEGKYNGEQLLPIDIPVRGDYPFHSGPGKYVNAISINSENKYIFVNFQYSLLLKRDFSHFIDLLIKKLSDSA